MRNVKKYFSPKVQMFYSDEGTISTFDLASSWRKRKKIIHMEIGMPNFDTPGVIKEANYFYKQR